MAVVQVGPVGVRVNEGGVLVNVGMGGVGGRVVLVVLVVVVLVFVLVFVDEGLVLVGMLVAFHEDQGDGTDHHERRYALKEAQGLAQPQ